MSLWRRRVYSKTYYQANKEKIAERNKIYGDKNREKLNEYGREYYKKNKEKLKEYGRKYADKNREKLNEYGRKYADKNREKINESAREYYKKNKEKIAEKGKRYRKKIQRSIWPEELINEIINLYKTGKTLEEISFITGKKIQSLRGKLIEYKVYIRDPNTYSEEEWKKYRIAYAKKNPERVVGRPGLEAVKEIGADYLSYGADPSDFAKSGRFEYNFISIHKITAALAGVFGYSNKEEFMKFLSYDPESTEAQVFDNELSL